MKARIIQKYIEKPLIVNENIKSLSKRKFDIRQWVLVKSFYPLKIYMFSSCYLRICSAEYNLDNIKSPLSHLTNYSLNKTAFKSKNMSIEESVCDLGTFQKYMREYTNKSWEADIKPQIIKIIINTLKCVQDSIEQKSSSFELFGFDIILDQYYNPWLLEVNLSPACSERTEWLTEMLDDMAYGLLNIVLPSEWLDKINKHPKNYFWELIFNEKDTNKENIAVINSNLNKLEIEGTKLDIKKEKNIDKKYYSLM